MNKRIKELLYEAGGQYGGKHFTTGQDVIYTEEVDYEKLAELIVEDCIFVMKSTVDESIDFHRKLDETSFWIESDIKEHFGVSK